MIEKSKTLIAIPLYNGGKYLSRTVLSCLSQTRKSEVWIFDNASTDNSLIVAESLANKHQNIKVIKSDQNIGRIGNWNRILDAFSRSDYEYIKFLFPGDEIHTTCIEKTEDVLERDSRIGALAFPYYFRDLSGKVSLSSHTVSGYIPPKEITRINLAEGMLLGAIVCNVYAKRAIRSHRFNPCHLSKAEFDIRVLESHGAYYIQETLATFNLESHSSFESSMTTWGFLEFSYIEAREIYRIAKGNMFSQPEIEYILNKIIYNAVANQLKFINMRFHVKLIFLLTRSALISSLMSTYRKIRHMRWIKK